MKMNIKLEPEMDKMRAVVLFEQWIWGKALENVRCILPSDAEDVKREAARLRKEIVVGVSDEAHPE